MDTRRRKPKQELREPEMRPRIEKHGMAGINRYRLHQDRGAMSVEYAILGSLIAAVIALVVMNLGNQVRLLFEAVTKGW